jgi:hypothetical protein
MLPQSLLSEALFNLEYIPFERLTYFLTHINNYGPSYDEVADRIKELAHGDKKYQKNSLLEDFGIFDYEENIHKNLHETNSEYKLIERVVTDKDKLFTWLQYDL